MEIVEIGERKFTRSNDKPWMEDKNPVQNKYTIKGDVVDSDEVWAFKRLEKTRVSSVDAFGYEGHRTTKRVLASTESLIEHVELIWTDKSGRFLKREEWNREGGRLVEHTLWQYEYDPKLKIEAPIK
jgi:hypothetical protein